MSLLFETIWAGRIKQLWLTGLGHGRKSDNGGGMGGAGDGWAMRYWGRLASQGDLSLPWLRIPQFERDHGVDLLVILAELWVVI